MHKQWDVVVGAGGTMATFTLDGANKLVALAVGLLTGALMAVRLFKEVRGKKRKTKTHED